MDSEHITINNNFVSRKFEINKLTQISSAQHSSIIIVYGRRRIGKTELIEQTLAKRNLLKFEGLEGYKEDQQMQFVVDQLASYAKEPLLQQINIKNWIQVFEQY